MLALEKKLEDKDGAKGGGFIISAIGSSRAEPCQRIWNTLPSLSITSHVADFLSLKKKCDCHHFKDLGPDFC